MSQRGIMLGQVLRTDATPTAGFSSVATLLLLSVPSPCRLLLALLSTSHSVSCWRRALFTCLDGITCGQVLRIVATLTARFLRPVTLLLLNIPLPCRFASREVCLIMLATLPRWDSISLDCMLSPRSTVRIPHNSGHFTHM